MDFSDVHGRDSHKHKINLHLQNWFSFYFFLREVEMLRASVVVVFRCFATEGKVFQSFLDWGLKSSSLRELRIVSNSLEQVDLANLVSGSIKTFAFQRSKISIAWSSPHRVCLNPRNSGCLLVSYYVAVWLGDFCLLDLNETTETSASWLQIRNN